MLKKFIRNIGISFVIMTVPLNPFSINANSASEQSTTIEDDTYFVLGMLAENRGRQIIEDGDKVDNFGWGKHLYAYVMLVYLNKIVKEAGWVNDLEIKRRDELSVQLHSKILSEYLNSFYDYEYNESGRILLGDEWKKHCRTNLKYSKFDNDNISAKLAYLAGAYFRFGKNNEFKLWDGEKKAKLIVKLLGDVGCPPPDIFTDGKFMGSSTFVTFQPTDELTQWFKTYPGLWALEAADTIIGLATNDELQIYRTVISALQNGVIEDCKLSFPCVVTRLNFIFGNGDLHMPGLTPEWQEALENYNNRRTEFVSFRYLSSDSIIVKNSPIGIDEIEECSLSIPRIGFSRDGLHALALIFYRCRYFKTCGYTVAFFLKFEDNCWKLTHYRVKNN